MHALRFVQARYPGTFCRRYRHFFTVKNFARVKIFTGPAGNSIFKEKGQVIFGCMANPVAKRSVILREPGHDKNLRKNGKGPEFLYNPRYISTIDMTETLETVVTGDPIDIPMKMQEMLHIRKGDRIRWTYEGDRLVAEVVKKRKGTLTSLIGKFSGEPTDAVKTHNLSGTR